MGLQITCRGLSPHFSIGQPESPAPGGLSLEGGESRKAGVLRTGVQGVNDGGRTFHGAALKVTDLQKDSACDLVY